MRYCFCYSKWLISSFQLGRNLPPLNDLYHSCTSFEGASWRGQPLRWDWVFLERTRILSGIQSATYFIEIFVVETKRFIGSFVNVILTRQTCGQRSSRACGSKRQTITNYFSERICYMFLISKCRGDRDLLIDVAFITS